MQVGRVAVFLPHEFVVTFAGVKLIGILWPFPGMRVCPDPQSAFSLPPPPCPCPHRPVGDVAFSSELANFPASLCERELGRALSLASLSEIGNCVTALLYYCELACENLLCLLEIAAGHRTRGGYVPPLHVGGGVFAFVLCEDTVGLESFTKCVRSFFPFLFFLRLPPLSTWVSDVLLVRSQARCCSAGSPPSFPLRSRAGGPGSYTSCDIWD